MKSPEKLTGRRNIGGNDQIVVDKSDADTEELPPGWKKEVKVRKTGSRTKTDRYYTDPVTGCIFHSFKDVQRYLKTGKVGKLATKPKPNTNTDGTCLSGNSSGPLSDVSVPDAAIKLEDREEKSVSKEQTMVPSPVSETSRRKRPLECGSDGYKTRSKSSETSKFQMPQRASKRLAGIDATPLSLSPEPKTRQAAKLAGIKIEAFDTPSPSPPESKTHQATRLAGIKPETPPLTPKTRHAMQLAGIKTEAPPATPPERKTRHGTQLAGVKTEAPPPTPPEPKTRHATQLAGIKIDASPQSLPGPKTRQARQLAGMEIDASPPSRPEPKARPARRLVEMEIDASPPPPEPKARQAPQLAGTEVGTPPPPPPEPKTRQATRLAGTEIGALPEPKTRHATRLAGTEVGTPPEPKTRQATRLGGTEIGAPSQPPPEPKTQQATRLAVTEIDASPASLPEPKTRKATRLAGNRIGASPPPLREPKTRQATRLAGIKTNSSPEPKTRRQDTVRRAREAESRAAVNLGTPKEIEKIVEVEKSTSQVEYVRKITEKSDGNAGMDNNSNRKQEIPILSPPTTQVSHEKIKRDNFKTNEKQEFVFSPNKDETGPAALPPVSNTASNQQAPPPPVAPPADPGIQLNDKHHGKQEPPVVNFNPSSVSNPIPQDGNAKPESSSSMNYCLNDFWTDPCIEFAVKTLTGAIPFGDLNKADNFAATPLEVPLEELWTDPCIEFAVKTLTGAIPVGEEDYLRHQPSSSRSENRTVQSFSLAPDVGMNFCQTEVLSKHFETVHNKQQPQKQESVGNGVLQKPGVGQGSNVNVNVNGQCSRARFF